MKNTFHRWEAYGMTVADNCLMVADLRTLDEYLALAAQIIESTAIDNEEFILRHSKVVMEQITRCRKMRSGAVSGRKQTKNKTSCAVVSDEELTDIADRMSHIYIDMGELAASEKLLHFLDNWSMTKTPYIKGCVCDAWTDYMDSLLDGCFTPQSEEEKALFKRQMKTLNKAIKYYEQSDTVSARCRLAADLIAKAAYLIRSADYEHDIARLRTRREAVDVLNHAKLVMDEADYQTTDSQNTVCQVRRFNLQNRYAYFMTKAWFYTYLEPSIQKAERSICSAQKIYEKARESELDLINYLMIPAANVYLELGDKERCRKWVKRAANVCDKNGELAAFCRKRAELEEILWEIET